MTIREITADVRAQALLELNTLGKLEDLAPGQIIPVGERGYIVMLCDPIYDLEDIDYKHDSWLCFDNKHDIRAFVHTNDTTEALEYLFPDLFKV